MVVIRLKPRTRLQRNASMASEGGRAGLTSALKKAVPAKEEIRARSLTGKGTVNSWLCHTVNFRVTGSHQSIYVEVAL